MTSPFVTLVNKENFEAEVLQSDKLVLIDFYADWCGPCRALSPRLEKFAEANRGTVKVVKVDVDKSPELARLFQIRSIPTLATMKDGKGLIKTVGLQTESQLKELVEKSLKMAAGNNINNNSKPSGKGPAL